MKESINSPKFSELLVPPGPPEPPVLPSEPPKPPVPPPKPLVPPSESINSQLSQRFQTLTLSRGSSSTSVSHCLCIAVISLLSRSLSQK